MEQGQEHAKAGLRASAGVWSRSRSMQMQDKNICRSRSSADATMDEIY
jgi:hypothetical protein